MLLAASVGSATAALVTSIFWEEGTIVSAAVTPVIVSLVGEGVRRPTERITQRRAGRRAASAGVPPGAAVGAGAGGESSGVEGGRAPIPGGGRQVPPLAGARGDSPTSRDEPARRSQMRTYGRARRRFRLGAALATGALAFVLAAIAITVPEVIAGESVVGEERTTLFGGRSSGSGNEEGADRSEKPEEEGEGQTEGRSSSSESGQETSPETPQTEERQAAPSEPAPSEGGSGSTAPRSSERTAPGSSQSAPSP